MSASELANREERPAHVSFERIPVEDKVASLREGRFVAVDVDYVNVTPAYSKDCFRSKATTWFAQVKQDVNAGRTPERWLEIWQEAYSRWLNGQEIPLNGTPIKGWGLISPAQQEMLIRINCLTVEDLAGANDEGLRRMGMGSMDLRNKAKAWLQSVNDHGPLTMEVAALKTENNNLRTEIATLVDQVMGLSAQVRAMAVPLAEIPASAEPIGVADILDTAPPAPVRKQRVPRSE